MAILITGSTGYLGSYIVRNLLLGHPDHLNLLIRAKDPHDAEVRLWKGMQLHFDFPEFHEYLDSRMRLFPGDLTVPDFGLKKAEYEELVSSSDSIIHCAASLNRKSEKTCLNVNLRGTLEVIQCARRAHADHRLRRFSFVSTVAVAGHRRNEIVTEDDALDWDLPDHDPYARTKKFCEHMVNELFPDVPRTIFRPSIVLGDSKRAETTQFDMVRAFAFLADLPVLPFRAGDKIDIVPVDFVTDAITTLHQKPHPMNEIYHLSSGSSSQTYYELTDALAAAQGKKGPIFVPRLEKAFASGVNLLSQRRGAMGRGASLMKVFLPYLFWNTQFDNTRVVTETGRVPAPFSQYGYPLLRFSKTHQFTYPYKNWPAGVY
jgi:thioester reductase-like protein